MHDGDLKAINTEAEPDRIRPRALDGVGVSRAGTGSTTVSAALPPASWTLVRLAASG